MAKYGFIVTIKSHDSDTTLDCNLWVTTDVIDDSTKRILLKALDRACHNLAGSGYSMDPYEMARFLEREGYDSVTVLVGLDDIIRFPYVDIGYSCIAYKNYQFYLTRRN